MNEITAAMRLEMVALGLSPTVFFGLLGFYFREKLKQILARSEPPRVSRRPVGLSQTVAA